MRRLPSRSLSSTIFRTPCPATVPERGESFRNTGRCKGRYGWAVRLRSILGSGGPQGCATRWFSKARACACQPADGNFQHRNHDPIGSNLQNLTRHLSGTDRSAAWTSKMADVPGWSARIAAIRLTASATPCMFTNASQGTYNSVDTYGSRNIPWCMTSRHLP